MRDYIEDACDNIDAAMFSGDAFLDPEHRKELRDYMARWERKMKEWEEIEKENPT
jgi:ADP-dependent phosphofructokinase/glucokinase